MTISQAEFLRSLSPLRRYYRIEIDETAAAVDIFHPTFRAVLQLRLNKPLKIGSLSMPSLQVDFQFKDSDRDEVAKFWSRFDLCFRRGGG
ncbi:MAG: hypothetical protein ABW092_12730 [Candidatus Thiodiazotropha sp.]